jgi:hypothetical protein
MEARMNLKRPRTVLPAKVPNPYSQMLSRAVPTDPVTAGGVTQESGNYSLSATMFLTAAGQISQLYSADRQWASLTLTLETAGPVEVSTQKDFLPFLSGKGQTLQTGVPLKFVVPRGSNVFIGAPSVNRVKVTVEPYPWLEQILASVSQAAATIAAALGGVLSTRKG